MEVVSESFMENAQRSSRPRASGVMARVAYEEEEHGPSSLVERPCDSQHCDNCDAYRERLCAMLYSSRPSALPPEGHTHLPSIDDLDWGPEDPVDAPVAFVEPSPFTLRSPGVVLASAPIEDAEREVPAQAPPAPMHLATCEGESCQTCGAYGDRLCSLLYGV